MMNGRNQYICDYCKRPCFRSGRKSLENKGAFWQVCFSCLTGYSVNAKGIVKRRILTCPDPKDSSISYEADIIPKYNKTLFIRTKTLPYLNKKGKPAKDQVLLMELPSSLPDITTTNMYNKIKTYILFS